MLAKAARNKQTRQLRWLTFKCRRRPHTERIARVFCLRGTTGGCFVLCPSIRNACNSQNFANASSLGPQHLQHLQRPTALVTAASTARESVSRGQLRTGPGTFDRDFGLACYRKRVTDRSPDSKLGGDTYWARALSCALSCSVSWELVLALVLALFARCVLGAVLFSEIRAWANR